MDDSQAVIRQKKEQILAYIGTLPKDRDSYGLIHAADLLAGNYFVDPRAQTVTVFDFDDCACGWFAMDVAMNLFDLLVLYASYDPDDPWVGKFMPGRRERIENGILFSW